MLLEVMIALLVLSAAGLGLCARVAAVQQEVIRLGERERRLREADRILAAMALLSARDLDLRLGHREVAGYDVAVGRPEPALYRIAVAAVERPEYELLVTVVHRPELPVQ